jgi:hypothetical protein
MPLQREDKLGCSFANLYRGGVAIAKYTSHPICGISNYCASSRSLQPALDLKVVSPVCGLRAASF